MNETDSNLKVDENATSEEVQAIIDRMPIQWTKTVALCIGIFMSIVILLGFLIKYPDTVDGQITITGNVAPVRLVANSNGRLQLLQPNKATLRSGDVISYMESGADYKDILYLDSMLNNMDVSRSVEFPLPESLLLGEVSSAYNRFLLSYMQYNRILTSDIYVTMRKNLEHKIVSDEHVIRNIDEELTLKDIILSKSKDRLEKDSILLAHKGISDVEYERQYSEYLSLQESQLTLRSNRLLKYSEINSNRIEIQRYLLEEVETREAAYSELTTNRNELDNSLSLWKERYLQFSPIDGELEYMGFWRDNISVQSGQELFSIIPDKNSIIGEVVIPSYGAGKVEVGQTANVKVNNFPYDEYGLLKGVVSSISRITNKIQTAEGVVADTYQTIISFPDGTVTNFGKELSLDFETKGTAEIITKRKRLIERLFDNLKSKGEK
jgi:hypothetical protein